MMQFYVTSHTETKSPVFSVAKHLIASSHKVALTKSVKVSVLSTYPKPMALSENMFISM